MLLGGSALFSGEVAPSAGEDEEQDRMRQHERGVLHGELAWDMNMSVDDCRCTSELLEHAPLPVTM